MTTTMRFELSPEDAERFWRKVNRDGPVVKEALGRCWVWTGSRERLGYGKFYVSTATAPTKAHRVAWQLTYGAMPDGLEPDHLCENPACVRPKHLEWVTHAENIRRGRQVEVCRNGHAMTADNVYVRPTRPGARQCRICKAAQEKAAYERRMGRA